MREKRSGKISIIITVLVISLAANIILSICLANGKSEKPIRGTYCTGNGPTDTNQYIVFEQNGVYGMYRQFESLEKGSYEPEGRDMIYLLSPSGDMHSECIVYDGADTIYIYNLSENQLEVYERISEEAVYVNVDMTGE